MSRRGLLAVLDAELARQKAKREGKLDPFEEGPALPVEPPELPDDPRQVLRWEREYVKYFVSGHPFDFLDESVFAGASTILSVREDAREGSTVNLVGIVSDVNSKKTRRGSSWDRFELEDRTGAIRCFAFGKATGVKDGYLVSLRGDVEDRDSEKQIKVKNWAKLEEW
jgi:DNA polymerase-3 subunit alpha